MKIGIVGPTYQERSLPFDAQRSINFYPVLDQMGKEVASLYGTPGLSLFTTVDVGPIRDMFFAANGRFFVVSGQKLVEISSNGTVTERGVLSSSTGICSMDENGVQLAVCDGASVYIFTYATNAFAQVTDVDLPQSGTITFIDGFFIVNKVGTGQFYKSGLFDGLSWAALDFATAESSPDPLVRVKNAVGQLWLFGNKTTEVWTNTDDSTFPFERISGAKLETGILAAHTAVAIDNSIFWVGRDNIGSGIVYRANGFTPQRISTHAIEIMINKATDKTNMRSYTYQENGHVFYVITGGGLETSLVYDITSDLWHERAFLEENGTYGQHLGVTGAFAFDKFYVGSRVDGKIYQMAETFYSDAGNEIKRRRVYTHISDEDKRIRFNKLEIGVEVGVGLQSGQGSDPKITLFVSKDGARTWSNGFQTSIGKVGQYLQKVCFRRLGVAEQITFAIEISDPVKVAITGSYLE